jgi:cyclophilin family peptidyl-prolyl cis-trans isomerase
MITLRFSVSRLLLLTAMAGMLATAACSRSAEKTATEPPKPLLADIETDKGTIEIELLPEAAPKAVENFRLLAQRGFYNGLTFHRIVKDFMIQGGDPLGDGRGGESAWGGTFEDEIDKHSALYRDGYKRGSVAMANSGPNTNQSQFFIVQKDYPLPPSYTIFGRVTKGIEVVDALADTPCGRGMDGNMSQPITPPVMKKVTVRAGAATPAKN